MTDYTPMLRKQAMLGYEKPAWDLIEHIWLNLKRDQQITEAQLDYLVECLRRTIDTKDANKGFNLKLGRGKRRSPTYIRDITAARFMVETEKSTLSYEERLQKAVEMIHREFPEALADIKTVEAAYTKYGEEVKKHMIEMAKLQPLL